MNRKFAIALTSTLVVFMLSAPVRAAEDLVRPNVAGTALYSYTDYLNSCTKDARPQGRGMPTVDTSACSSLWIKGTAPSVTCHAGAVPTIPLDQAWSCDRDMLVCPTGWNDCRSTNSKCQLTNTSCASAPKFRQSTCDSTAGVTTQRCGNCLPNYSDCGVAGANCVDTRGSCSVPGQTWSWNNTTCSGSCSGDPYAYAYGSATHAPQTGNIIVTGNVSAGGDLVMANGQVIRADLAAQKSQIFFRNGTGIGNNTLEVDMHNAVLVVGLKANWTTAVSLSHGDNVIYGAADWTSMNNVDDAIKVNPALKPASLLLLEVETGQGMRNRLRVDKSGNLILGGGGSSAELRLRGPNESVLYTALTAQTQTTNLTYKMPASNGIVGQVLSIKEIGNLQSGDGPYAELEWDSPAAGGVCASTRKFVGFSTNFYDGNLDVSAPSSPAESELGYVKADSKCSSYDIGALKSYVCTTEEIFQSIKCDLAGPIQQADNLTGWVNGGPPGYNASSNDCTGWTSDSGAEFVKGRVWAFDKDSGGIGYVSFCNTARKFACCR